MLGDAGIAGGWLTACQTIFSVMGMSARQPSYLGKDRSGLHPAPVLAQSLQQLRSQQHVAVNATLAAAHMNHHALAVDVGDLEMAQLGPAQARCV